MNYKNIYNGINFEYLLLENYKEMDLTNNELLVLLMTEQLIKSGVQMVSLDMLQLKLKLNPKEIDEALNSLYKKSYIKYVKTSNGLMTILDALYDDLVKIFNSSLKSLYDIDDNFDSVRYEIFEEYEKAFARPLNQIEVETIEKWLQNGISQEIIINSLKDCESFNKLNLYNVSLEVEKRVKQIEHEKLY